MIEVEQRQRQFVIMPRSIFLEDCSMRTTDIREEAKRLIDKLSPDSSWDDLMHEIYVRQAIESGLADSQAGRTIDVKEVRKRFGLPA